jgi:hypothetical protein
MKHSCANGICNGASNWSVGDPAFVTPLEVPNLGLILADRASWDRIGRRRRPSSTAPGLPSVILFPEEWPGANTSVYSIRYQRDPLVHGNEEPSASSQYEQYIWHFYLVGRPHAGITAFDLGQIVAGRSPVSDRINRPLPQADHVGRIGMLRM